MEPITTSKSTRGYGYSVLVTIKSRKIICYAPVATQRQQYPDTTPRKT